MLAEMEFTGQAFEEMQEQNVRLLQQLREKDDANLKLMSEVRKVCNQRSNAKPECHLRFCVQGILPKALHT